MFPSHFSTCWFAVKVSFVDAAVANLTAAIRAKPGMWANTLLVWTNDNGSPVSVGGSNHPLRGGKGSNWEGGTRVPAFVQGGRLPDKMRGTTHGGLIAIAQSLDPAFNGLGCVGIFQRAVSLRQGLSRQGEMELT